MGFNNDKITLNIDENDGCNFYLVCPIHMFHFHKNYIFELWAIASRFESEFA